MLHTVQFVVSIIALTVASFSFGYTVAINQWTNSVLEEVKQAQERHVSSATTQAEIVIDYWTGKQVIGMEAPWNAQPKDSECRDMSEKLAKQNCGCGGFLCECGPNCDCAAGVLPPVCCPTCPCDTKTQLVQAPIGRTPDDRLIYPAIINVPRQPWWTGRVLPGQKFVPPAPRLAPAPAPPQKKPIWRCGPNGCYRISKAPVRQTTSC